MSDAKMLGTKAGKRLGRATKFTIDTAQATAKDTKVFTRAFVRSFNSELNRKKK